MELMWTLKRIKMIRLILVLSQKKKIYENMKLENERKMRKSNKKLKKIGIR